MTLLEDFGLASQKSLNFNDFAEARFVFARTCFRMCSKQSFVQKL